MIAEDVVLQLQTPEFEVWSQLLCNLLILKISTWPKPMDLLKQLDYCKLVQICLKSMITNSILFSARISTFNYLALDEVNLS